MAFQIRSAGTLVNRSIIRSWVTFGSKTSTDPAAVVGNISFHTSLVKMSNDETLFDGNISGGVTALTTGAPGAHNLRKVSLMMGKAIDHMNSVGINKDGGCHLQYGPKQGSPRFRQQCAQFLSRGYGDTVNASELFVTAGATHGFHFVASILLPSGAPVFVEDPTYFIAFKIAKDDLGMPITPVTTDPKQGMDLDELERRLQEYSVKYSGTVTEKKPFWGMIYLVPTYHNPLGFSYSPERCQAVVALAKKYGVMVMCDDVYNLLHFEEGTIAPPRLLSYDKGASGNTVSNGSFSKIMGPGLRLGWIEAAPNIINMLVGSNVAWSAGSSNQLTSEMVASALELGIEQDYLRELNAEYRENTVAMCRTLEEYLPKGCSFTGTPKGGYFLWVTLPENAKAAEVARICLEEYKIRVLNGAMCSYNGNFTNCIRLSFSHYPKDVLIDATQKFCQSVAKHLDSL